MIKLIRTDSTNSAFIELVKLLDAELHERDGAEHAFYQQFNGIQLLQHVVVLFDEENPIGCGAFKNIEPGVIEIKRMYILPEHRSKGFASMILDELEKWASASGYKTARLETGKRQPEAIALYKKKGYAIIPNYGQYIGIDNSVCFQKTLIP